MSAPSAGAAPPIVAAIRYMGNKQELLPAIVETIARVAAPGSLVVDPMAGSHAVTQALKHRHRLVTSDAQEYSAVVGRALVDNVTLRRAPPDRVEALLAAARARLEEREGPGFFEEAFSETYLGATQCRQLDALRDAVDAVATSRADPFRWLALAALLAAACRAQASPGHFAQFLPPDHPRTGPLRRIDLLRVVGDCLAAWDVVPGTAGSRSFALPWRDLVRDEGARLEDAAAWYLDPPYTRDQYSRFYHFLETIARGDRPTLAHGARYRDDRFQSAFCSSVRVEGELSELLAAIRRVSPRAAVVLSYSSRGLLAQEQLVACASPAFAVTWRREIPHVYSTQGKGNLGGVREWLLLLEPLSPAR